MLTAATETARALREEEMRLLYATSLRIGAAVSVEEVVAAYLEQVAEGGRYACTIALYERDAVGTKTSVRVCGRWMPGGGMSLQEIVIPYTQDALDPPLDAGETITIEDVHTDMRVTQTLRDLQSQSGRPALAMIPLMVWHERVGLVILSHPRIHTWSNADLRPYQATAAHLATALESRRQALLLTERAQQLAILEERARLARDLHDSVTQQLFSLNLIAQTITPVWKRDPEEGERRLNRLLELSQAALAEMRGLLMELRPSAPERPPLSAQLAAGLSAALQTLATACTRDGLPVRVTIQDGLCFSDAGAEAFFRIAQEALHNVRKHAAASQAELHLSGDAIHGFLTVSDNGKGFALPPPELRETVSGSMGLRNMSERAAALGGTFQIESQPGAGTVVRVTIPFVREAV